MVPHDRSDLSHDRRGEYDPRLQPSPAGIDEWHSLSLLIVESSGVEDILEKVDLSIVFEYQHVFEHVGKLPEFKQLYIERREVTQGVFAEG